MFMNNHMDYTNRTAFTPTLTPTTSGVITTSVCERSIPPDKKTGGKRSFEKTKLGAGEQFLPLDCRAKAGAQGVFSQTPVALLA